MSAVSMKAAQRNVDRLNRARHEQKKRHIREAWELKQRHAREVNALTDEWTDAVHVVWALDKNAGVSR